MNTRSRISQRLREEPAVRQTTHLGSRLGVLSLSPVYCTHEGPLSGAPFSTATDPPDVLEVHLWSDMVHVCIVGCKYGCLVHLPAIRMVPRCKIIALAVIDTAETAAVR